MYLSDDLIEEIRSRNDIVDVISSYVKLQKKGSSYLTRSVMRQILRIIYMKLMPRQQGIFITSSVQRMEMRPKHILQRENLRIRR